MTLERFRRLPNEAQYNNRMFNTCSKCGGSAVSTPDYHLCPCGAQLHFLKKCLVCGFETTIHRNIYPDYEGVS